MRKGVLLGGEGFVRFIMFEPRDYKVSFFVSLILSAGFHILLLWFVRVEVSIKDVAVLRSVVERRRFLFGPSPKLEYFSPGRMVVVEIAPGEEEREEFPSPTPEKRVRPIEIEGEVWTELEEEGAIGGLFTLDSLDLLLTYPWIIPPVEKGTGSHRLTGLERALARLRGEELERREEEELTLDTKYGKFGISPRGLFLGPLVIPLPLTPYQSSERRREEDSYREIRAQSLQKSLRDPDLKEQRDRVIEWKKRRGREP